MRAGPGRALASEAVASTLGALEPPEDEDQGDDDRGHQTAGGHELAQQAARAPRAALLRRAGAIGLDALAQRERRHRLRDSGGDERAAALGELVVEGVHGDVLVGGNHGLSL